MSEISNLHNQILNNPSSPARELMDIENDGNSRRQAREQARAERASVSHQRKQRTKKIVAGLALTATAATHPAGQEVAHVAGQTITEGVERLSEWSKPAEEQGLPENPADMQVEVNTETRDQ